MGFTNKTPNYNLPQWIGTDQPTWLVDVNGAFSAIDTAISDVNVTATGAKNTADSASGLASTAKDAADAATQAATDATTAATAATNAATAATEKATQAEQTASAAAGTASTAITNANNAVQVANNAETKANQAIAQSGIGTWYTKALDITSTELIPQLHGLTSYYFPYTSTFAYNDKLKLMSITIGVKLDPKNTSLTTYVPNFDGKSLNFFPLVKLPFTYSTNKAYPIPGSFTTCYQVSSNTTPTDNVTVAAVFNGGIWKYNNGTWFGIVTNNISQSFSPNNPQFVVLPNYVLMTSEMGEVTLDNWSAA